MSLPPNLGPRNGILSLTIKDKSVLYAAYMPFLRCGGIFIPTTRSYSVGDEVLIEGTGATGRAVGVRLANGETIRARRQPLADAATGLDLQPAIGQRSDANLVHQARKHQRARMQASAADVPAGNGFGRRRVQRLQGWRRLRHETVHGRLQ